MRVQLAPNPVLIKELRGRMRGPRAYLFLTATLALLGAVSYGLYRLAAEMTQYSFGGLPQGAVIGQGVFTGLVFLALMVICAAAPFLTAGTISGEFERKTFDLLLATPLRPAALLFGKLAAALSFIALILLAATPLASLAFVFGGITAEDMVKAFLLLLGFAVTFSVIGLFFSALFRRTGPALVASYLLMALFILGTTFAYIVNGTMGRQPPPSWLLAPNPFVALASSLTASAGNGNPAFPGRSPGIEMFGSLLSVLGIGASGLINATTPLWHYTCGIYGWLSVAMYLVSTQLIKPVRRFRFRARTWVTIAFLLLASLLAFPIIYGPFTPARLVAWVRWLNSSPHELVANGAFTDPLEGSWKMDAKETDEAKETIEQVDTDGRPTLRLARTGDKPGEISLTQIISQTVPADSWLQVRAVLRIESQDVASCGERGDKCPLTIKLIYDDAEGRQHEWRQGFFLTPGPYMPFCDTCETRQAHTQVQQDQWYTYESPNLLQPSQATFEWQLKGMPYILPPPPRFIRSIVVSAAGNSFEARVAEVALISQEGQPLVWRTSSTGPVVAPTEAPAFMVPPRAIERVEVKVDAAATPIATPPPTPTAPSPPAKE